MGNTRINVMEALVKSWDEQTCYPKSRENWNTEKPEVGQCAVTALVIQDYFGGIIYFSYPYNHFFNVIDGEIVDYTAGQFVEPPDRRDAYEVTRRKMLFGERAEKAETLWRYSRLLFAFSRHYAEARP